MSTKPDIASNRLAPDAIAERFSDVHPPFDISAARVAAERCLFCYDAPCISACPTTIDIPLFIRQIATGNPLGSAKTIFSQNILGGMCARVCPTETLCEEACVRNAAEGKPVEIGLLQRFATDAWLESGHQGFRRAKLSGKRVAVVGAGPAGLACAHRLAQLGHDVVILDAREKPGGLNEYGIAAYKTPDGFAAREVDFILSIGGISIECDRRLGRDFTLPDLSATHDAVFLAFGLGGVNALGIPDAVAGVEDAVDFIAALRQSADLASIPVGRRIVVIGGGMTAIDVASQAKRLGAEDVTIVYRRGHEHMNASPYERELAQTDGVLIRPWGRPTHLVTEAGRLVAVEIEYTTLVDDKLVGTGETYHLPCDQLFKAIGQTFVSQEAGSGNLVLVSGRIEIDDERRTSLPGVWAGGDCVAGGEDLTVAAVADGREAAMSIDRALRATV